jgi:pimeloyl-ACP methyl ester carboxylesterase
MSLPQSVCSTGNVKVWDPEPIHAGGREGVRYWVQAPEAFTGDAEIDDRLSSYPVAVFVPAGRPASETPVVLGLQGLAAPWQFNAFLVPTLLDMGIACVLFDTPLGGERSLTRNFLGDMPGEVKELASRGQVLNLDLMAHLFKAAARDVSSVLRLVRERHGLTEERVALFGVSLGTLLTALAFLRDGVGQRLLGTIGHPDLTLFARTYRPAWVPIVTSPPLSLIAVLAQILGGVRGKAALGLFRLMNELCRGTPAAQAINPMTYADRVGPGRPVRLLVGGDDPVVRVEDAQSCAERVPDGACYVVPGMGHGGPGFEEHVRYFIGTQLGDWR